jgi:hypothetical protein
VPLPNAPNSAARILNIRLNIRGAARFEAAQFRQKTANKQAFRAQTSSIWAKGLPQTKSFCNTLLTAVC